MYSSLLEVYEGIVGDNGDNIDKDNNVGDTGYRGIGDKIGGGDEPNGDKGGCYHEGETPNSSDCFYKNYGLSMPV